MSECGPDCDCQENRKTSGSGKADPKDIAATMDDRGTLSIKAMQCLKDDGFDVGIRNDQVFIDNEKDKNINIAKKNALIALVGKNKQQYNKLLRREMAKLKG